MENKTKICTICKTEKILLEFFKRSDSRDGRDGRCKKCEVERRKRYSRKTESIRKKQAEWYVLNCERERVRVSEYRKLKLTDTPGYGDYLREKSRTYKKKHKPEVNANNAKRRATKLQATPIFANLDKIKSIYKQAECLTKSTGVKHQVDHVVPLRSKLVCGLHWEENLQILTEEDNLKKSNKFWPNMP